MRSRAAAIGATALLALGIAVPAGAAPSQPVAASRAGACAWEPGTTEPTIISGGVERRALVHVPSGTNPGRPLPVVLNLHGSGSTPEEQMARSGLEVTADEEGFVVVAPQGGVVSGTGWAWNVPHVTSAAGAPGGDQRCRQEATTTQVTESVTVTSDGACKANRDTVLYTIEGGGHTWPGSDPSMYPAVLLPVTQEIDADAIMWEFFRTRVSTSRG